MTWEPANDRARTEQSDTFVALSISKARANEAGNYKLILKNVAGSAEASFDVRIQNVPQPVRNLKIDNIHAESAHVTWEAPLDDGGLPINSYFVEYRDLRRSQYSRSERLTAQTLDYELSRLTKGSKYTVRVLAENKLGQSEPTEITEPFTAKNPFDVPSAPRELKVTGVTRSTCQLQWLPPNNDGGAPIKGYIVERQTEKRWIRAVSIMVEGTTVQLVDLIEGKRINLLSCTFTILSLSLQEQFTIFEWLPSMKKVKEPTVVQVNLLQLKILTMYQLNQDLSISMNLLILHVFFPGNHLFVTMAVQ